MSQLASRPFGRTGLSVSALGLGAGELGDAALDERDVETLLRTAVDCGVTLFDTARSYGESEARIGRFLAPVRDRVVLSTKIGYGVEGVADWTGECIRRGVDQALARMATDRIEIVHLHSCPIEILERGEVIAALHEARAAGKLRCAAYSGDNEALAWAAASGHFDSLQMSFSVCDQRAAPVIEQARVAGLGVIAKRPLANAPWRFAEQPVGHEAEPYWQRWQALALDAPALISLARAGDPDGFAGGAGASGPRGIDEVAARFAAHAPGVSSAIAGTRQVAHLCHNVEIVARGPLPAAVVEAIRARYQAVGAAWPSRI